MSTTTDTAQSAQDAPKKTIKVIGFGMRLISTIIDGVIVWALTFVIVTMVGVGALLLDLYTPNRPIRVDALSALTAIVLALVYYIAAWSRSGQTVGKAFLGIKVVAADGEPPSGGKAFLRFVGYFVNAVLLSLGFLWVALDRKRQGWHDKLASTFVVYSDAEFSSVDDVDLVPADSRPGWVWLVAWLLFALIAPGALLSGLLILGPAISIEFTNWLQGLIG